MQRQQKTIHQPTEKGQRLMSSSLMIPHTPFASAAVDISNSEFRSFNDCIGKWFFKCVLRLRGTSTKRTLAIGGMVHEVLAAYYEPTTSVVDRTVDLLWDLFDEVYGERTVSEVSDEKGEIYRLIRSMLKGYWEHWAHRDFEPADTEVRFRVPIFGPDDRLTGFFHGILDATAVYQGKIWIIDHKTTKKFAFKHLVLDPQIDHYSLAGTKLFGDKFGGMVFNYIRTRISTRSPNFQRIRVHRSVDELQFAEHNLARTMNRMGMMSPHQVSFAFDKDCMWKCAFTEVCIAMRSGIPIDRLIQHRYRIRLRDPEDEWESG